MNQSDFERRVKKYKPSLITIGKVLVNGKWVLRELFVHFPEAADIQSKCYLKVDETAFEDMIKMLEEIHGNSKT